jgi:hypothetical protein
MVDRFARYTRRCVGQPHDPDRRGEAAPAMPRRRLPRRARKSAPETMRFRGRQSPSSQTETETSHELADQAWEAAELSSSYPHQHHACEIEGDRNKKSGTRMFPEEDPVAQHMGPIAIERSFPRPGVNRRSHLVIDDALFCNSDPPRMLLRPEAQIGVLHIEEERLV